ncbi:MAG TPA: cytochrome P450, partial [Thermomicrobiales bacterium]|nr:cytochrome P450 [Thermomicrobiales bacterium]
MATKSIEAQDDAMAQTAAENGAGRNGGDNGATDVVELDLRDPQFMATAYDKYKQMREQGRVVRVRFARDEAETNEADAEEERARNAFFRRDTNFVTHYDDVIATLLDDRFSVDPRSHQIVVEREDGKEPEIPEEFRPLSRMLLTIDPPDHDRIRKLVQPSFTGRTMNAMRGKIEAIVNDLLDKAEVAAGERGETAPNRRMELIDAFAYPFPVTVISDLLGIPREDRDRIKGWTENLLRVDRGRDRAMNEEVRAGLREFTAYLRELFERKRREPTDDMISQLVHAAEDGDVLSEDETLATVFLMYLAGHVTTVNLVGNGVVALLTHPEQWAKLQGDPTLAKNVVEETLRYWGPVDFVGRRIATQEMDVAGTTFEPGQEATMSLASANRDPAKFANPDAYDIERADANRHVAFGKGIHVCLGAPLA